MKLLEGTIHVRRIKCVMPTLLAALVAISCACGAATQSPTEDPGSKISMKVNDREVSFEPTYARFATFKKDLILDTDGIHDKTKRVPSVVHRIYLANFDLALTDPGKSDLRPVKNAGEYLVEIQIEAAKDAAEDAPLRPGVYEYRREPFDRLSWVFMGYLHEGKSRSENLQAAEMSGTLTLTSVTETEIEGTIDVFDRKEFVKGNFKAQKLISNK